MRAAVAILALLASACATVSLDPKRPVTFARLGSASQVCVEGDKAKEMVLFITLIRSEPRHVRVTFDGVSEVTDLFGTNFTVNFRAKAGEHAATVQPDGMTPSRVSFMLGSCGGRP